MGLISCRECSTKLSDQAPACPSCGAPQAGVVTVQQTARRLKAAQLAGALGVALGTVLIIVGQHLTGVGVSVAGLLVYGIARARAWWRHG